MMRRALRLLAHGCLGLVLVALWATLLMTPGSAPIHIQAHAARGRLDRELAYAQRALGIPAALLASIVTAERQVAAHTLWNTNDQLAAADYQLLYSQVLDVERTSTETLREQAQGDLQLFLQALDLRRGQGFDAIYAYQARLAPAMQALAAAKTTAEYARVDAFLSAQLDALRALWPAYQKLQDFNALLRTFRLAGMPSALGEAASQQDADILRAAAAPARYARLPAAIDGQMLQVMTDQVAALPAAAPLLLRRLRAQIDLLRQGGGATLAAPFLRQYDQDQRALAAAAQPLDYLALSQAILQQEDAMTLPLLRLQASRDLGALARLIAYAQTRRLLDPATGAYYPAAFEYADKEAGYGRVLQELTSARTVGAVQQADDDIAILTTNLRALLDDLRDPTAHARPHRTDLRLLTQYGLLQGRVIVVSLVEQTARLYDDGRLVYWSYVTTGRIELPSPPGIHYAMSASSPVLFVSPEPRGSPFWFAPTPVTYAILYAPGGDFLHDAWWRSRFGPGTNLPHYEPEAFNGGSHGCINFPLAQMRWVYAWTQVGTPIVVY